MSSARKIAYKTLLHYEKKGGALRAAIEESCRRVPGLEDRDKAFSRDLVSGVVQRRNTLDWCLNQVSRRKIDSLDPAVRASLRLGAFQMLFMRDRAPAYAAVNESVELAKEHAPAGAAAFVNGVLRSLERKRDGLPWPDEGKQLVQALSLRHSHPEW
ncbi:MAG: 16S rRNA (cytosine(967)-C(5))-methyltransferase RsmB, partial [Elusimicrobia bacterium]|nr:16S rRNA (cytosine(967)-C(5))-methyltransferase RsmB [Elusimicrobiota bacterium]